MVQSKGIEPPDQPPRIVIMANGFTVRYEEYSALEERGALEAHAFQHPRLSKTVQHPGWFSLHVILYLLGGFMLFQVAHRILSRELGKEIGSGGGRTVYAHPTDPTLVVKKAKNKYGVQQNIQEQKVSLDYPDLTPTVVDLSEDGVYLVVKRVTPATDFDVYRLLGINTDHLRDLLYFVRKNQDWEYAITDDIEDALSGPDTDYPGLEDVLTFWEDQVESSDKTMFKRLLEMAKEYGYDLPGDLFRIANMGIDDRGNFVWLDLGGSA